jgi:excisionase family DNA binding protein
MEANANDGFLEKPKTPQEASKILGVGVNTLKFLVKKGKLKQFKLGREVRFRVSDLRDFLNSPGK